MDFNGLVQGKNLGLKYDQNNPKHLFVKHVETGNSRISYLLLVNLPFIVVNGHLSAIRCHVFVIQAAHLPICSMYEMFINIGPKNHPNVRK